MGFQGFGFGVPTATSLHKDALGMKHVIARGLESEFGACLLFFFEGCQGPEFLAAGFRNWDLGVFGMGILLQDTPIYDPYEARIP